MLSAALERNVVSEEQNTQIRERVKAYEGQDEVFCHGDLHLSNIINVKWMQKGGLTYNRACLIDFGYACTANRFYDLAYLLEQAPLNFTEDDKKELVDYFVGELKTRGISLDYDIYHVYQAQATLANAHLASIVTKWAQIVSYEKNTQERDYYLKRLNVLNHA